MKPKIRVSTATLALTLLITSGVARAAQPFAGCLEEFWASAIPATDSTGITDALCASHFATLYSEATETPVYSAEHLTPGQIEAAIHLHRMELFHQDDRLSLDVASSLEDYRHSGYDRGHMAPDADEPDAPSQWESFALSNMVPQDANDNRGLWADIEYAVRELVLADGDDVYVVTGPIFGQADPPALHGRVQVPQLLFKAVYDQTAGIAGVYVAENAPGKKYWSLSLADFQSHYEIQPFPALSGLVTQMESRLPPPAADARFHDQSGW